MTSDMLFKKLMYQCTHRGSKEMDFLLGRFARASLAGLSVEDLAALEQILACDDAPLYAFLTQGGPLPIEEASPLVAGVLQRMQESVLS